MSKKATDPRNKHRGTKLTQLRLRDDSKAHIETIRAHLSVDGAAVPVAEAVRVALRIYAEQIETARAAAK